ncbi:hypothetical protein MNB_SM-4-84 [hydrothermal vent metagenome]|uniref:Thioredoxin-like fold domain-containing protein n=1 Tax=hydrothermal vent metagenome TaxID=652676 RepID=A0A1W1CBV0_9ZZZZ
MKKVYVLFFLLIASSLFGDKIHWAKDFDSGVKMATQEKKPILFVFSRHTCHYCKILEETTFSDARVIEHINKNFVAIIAYSDDNDAMPQELWRPGTPTLWFLNSKGKAMYQPLVGAIKADNFLNALDVVEKKI